MQKRFSVISRTPASIAINTSIKKFSKPNKTPQNLDEKLTRIINKCTDVRENFDQDEIIEKTKKMEHTNFSLNKFEDVLSKEKTKKMDFSKKETEKHSKIKKPSSQKLKFLSPQTPTQFHDTKFDNYSLWNLYLVKFENKEKMQTTLNSNNLNIFKKPPEKSYDSENSFKKKGVR